MTCLRLFKAFSLNAACVLPSLRISRLGTVPMVCPWLPMQLTTTSKFISPLFFYNFLPTPPLHLPNPVPPAPPGLLPAGANVRRRSPHPPKLRPVGCSATLSLSMSLSDPSLSSLQSLGTIPLLASLAACTQLPPGRLLPPRKPVSLLPKEIAANGCAQDISIRERGRVAPVRPGHSGRSLYLELGTTKYTHTSMQRASPLTFILRVSARPATASQLYHGTLHS